MCIWIPFVKKKETRTKYLNVHMKWCVFFHYRVHTAGWSSEDEIFGNNTGSLSISINHVKTLSNGDSPELVRFEWAKARTLAKVKRECAEAVWAKSQQQQLS